MCRTLLTVPPFPCPRSFKTSKSSLFRSSLYSIPISSCAVCLAFSLLLPPGICRSLSEGATVRGAGAARASPLTFLRFSVRTEPMASDMARSAASCARHSGRQGVERRWRRALWRQQVRGQCWRRAGDAEAIWREQRHPWIILSDSLLGLTNIRRVAEEVAEFTVNCQGRDSGRPTARQWIGVRRYSTSPRSDALLEEQRQAGGQALLLKENPRNSEVQFSSGCTILERGHGAAWTELQTQLSHDFKVSTWDWASVLEPVQACLRKVR